MVPSCSVLGAVCRAGGQLSIGTLMPPPRPSQDAHQSHVLRQKVAPSRDPEGEGARAAPGLPLRKDIYEIFPGAAAEQKALLENMFPHRPTATSASTAQSRLAARCELAAAAPPAAARGGGTPLHPPHLHPPGERQRARSSPLLPSARQVPDISALSCRPAIPPELFFVSFFFFFFYYV